MIDANGNFLLPGVRKTRMRKIEDAFRYLGLDHLYLRFLCAWVFGEIGNLARHGDLPEVESDVITGATNIFAHFRSGSSSAGTRDRELVTPLVREPVTDVMPLHREEWMPATRGAFTAAPRE